MSQWTHVNASIRFDSLMGLGLPTEKELGKMCKWEDEDTSHWKDSILPCGSEGSIKYSIVRNPNKSSISAMVVVFYGDLRDYEDVDKILEYFTKITENRMIRSGILEIDVEFKEKLIYSYDEENNKWKKV